ncbi:hypothetical protein [Citromicrobium sp. JLT1363]|uniref:hypothetical protein n=1 Tax=Citromicrobium sp. JLT1363 TaxID=517722 RepID=UPI000225E7EC|nr:hypothetical protein [Citromicrobium sp. JLT1363]
MEPDNLDFAISIETDRKRRLSSARQLADAVRNGTLSEDTPIEVDENGGSQFRSLAGNYAPLKRFFHSAEKTDRQPMQSSGESPVATEQGPGPGAGGSAGRPASPAAPDPAHTHAPAPAPSAAEPSAPPRGDTDAVQSAPDAANALQPLARSVVELQDLLNQAYDFMDLLKDQIASLAPDGDFDALLQDEAGEGDAPATSGESGRWEPNFDSPAKASSGAAPTPRPARTPPPPPPPPPPPDFDNLERDLLEPFNALSSTADLEALKERWNAQGCANDRQSDIAKLFESAADRFWLIVDPRDRARAALIPGIASKKIWPRLREKTLDHPFAHHFDMESGEDLRVIAPARMKRRSDGSWALVEKGRLSGTR